MLYVLLTWGTLMTSVILRMPYAHEQHSLSIDASVLVGTILKKLVVRKFVLQVSLLYIIATYGIKIYNRH